jgi:hypothetical protein
MKNLLVLSAVLLTATASFAAVDVQKTSNFPSSITSLAIAPLPCSSKVNCVKIEKHLNKSVSKHFPAKVLGTDQVKQALFDMSMAQPTRESVIEAAKRLGCDAVMLPSLLGSEARDHWSSWNDPDTDHLHQYDSKSILSSVQVLILDLDGNLLMNGQASGESYLQTDQTLFAETQIDKILRKALE